MREEKYASVVSRRDILRVFVRMPAGALSGLSYTIPKCRNKTCVHYSMTGKVFFRRVEICENGLVLYLSSHTSNHSEKLLLCHNNDSKPLPDPEDFFLSISF
mmetsp:Transcript_1802/g.2521  ORF Transcript_1802/g.2521 Transcript_1802/m.2521 type:complete len:102 (+) Transcript_1802:539-844(+)